MHLAQLRLRDFRNYARLDAEFPPGFHLFLGDNAQGKTNILEAIYLVATTRSFRGAGGSQMIRHGQKGYFIGATVVSDGAHRTKVFWSPQQRSLTLDDRPVRRLSEYFGVFRAVVFSADDLQLVKGPSSRRRRFLDLLLTQTEPAYLLLLQRYTHSVRSRNALLKQNRADLTALEGFSRELIDAGNQIMQRRRQLLPALVRFAQEAHGRIAGPSDELRLAYRPAVRQDFTVELAQSRARERVLRTTVIGPHRDELVLSINQRPVDEFGSEGQKRSVAISLKMAQAEYLTEVHGTPPVLLIDDIMGELDATRRSAFVPLLQRVDRAGSQVFMTATEENWPAELGRQLHKWRVTAGQLRS
ncbi:MAG: DNA replication/repair protein RecF [Verrucomicrobiota bacterium]